MDAAVFEQMKDYLKQIFQEDVSGHDYAHTMRVYRMADQLAIAEHADRERCAYSSLLHDVDDYKLFQDAEINHDHARLFLERSGVAEEEIQRILHIIEQVSWNGEDSVVPDSLEGKIVQDADRLDAMGAIGIARAFAYGGAHQRLMHDPSILPQLSMSKEEYRNANSTTINHFYEKLLQLKDAMNTETAHSIALHRHAFMVAWLDEFYSEWNGEEILDSEEH